MRTGERLSPRLAYGAVFLLLLTVEICIAVFVHDRFIRPYVGDILVVGTLYAFVRVLFPSGLPWLPAGVTGFALLVEAGQAFGLVDLLGLGHIPFFRVLLGSTFDWADMVCYLIGGGLVLAGEKRIRRRKSR